MPSYDYKCENQECENHEVFEVKKSVNEPAPEVCTKCGSKVNRVWSATPNMWKTSGSYKPSHR